MLPAKLAPFHYQVGGHFVIMSLGDSLVCKPLGAREHLFYNAVPDSLKGFTPQYQGMKTFQLSHALITFNYFRDSNC